MRLTQITISAVLPLLASAYYLQGWTSSDCSGDSVYSVTLDDYTDGAQSDCTSFGADVQSVQYTDTLNAIYFYGTGRVNCFDGNLSDCDGSFSGANPDDFCYNVGNIGYVGLDAVGSFIVADKFNECAFQASKLKRSSAMSEASRMNRRSSFTA